jgi:hypothetical protein
VTDIYARGEPHKCQVTLTGHFTGMQASESAAPLESVWYRGDDWAALLAQSLKYRAGLQAIVAVFSDPSESGDNDTMLKILDIAEKALAP